MWNRTGKVRRKVCTGTTISYEDDGERTVKKLLIFLLSGCLMFKKLCFVSIIIMSILLCYDILANYVMWEVGGQMFCVRIVLLIAVLLGS